MLEKGKKVGEYVLLEKLGAGGFGDVWKAEKRTVLDSNHFALKFFRPKQDGVDFDKIGKELAVWKQLRGLPHIISVIELDRFEDYVYVVSDFADGGSLEKYLNKNGKARTETEAVQIALEILTGLENLHGKGFVHRDLKPDNILIMNGRFCLADFGISREIKTHSKATGTAGTMEYMPPEAFEKTPSVTPQTDIWAVGVILQRLLTGNLPYPQEDIPPLTYAIIYGEPDEMHESISESLRSIVKKALQKNRENRFQSASEMREVLRDILKSSQKVAQPQTASQAKTLVLEDSDKTAKLEITPIQEAKPIIEDNERETELRSFQTEIKTAVRQQINKARGQIDEDIHRTETLISEPIKDWREIGAEKLAKENEVAIVIVDENSPRNLTVSKLNNNSICEVLYSSAEFAPHCDKFCGLAFQKAIIAGKSVSYKCHAGLDCLAVPLRTEKPLVAIIGRVFTKAENYRQATERAISGDWQKFPPTEFFENVLLSRSTKKLETVAKLLEESERIRTAEAERIAKENQRTSTSSDNTFKNSIGMEFVKIPAGSFMMGSPMSEARSYDNQRPQHQVTISKDFYLGKYEVTQGQWKAVMGNNPSKFSSCGDDCPVESVSWDDVQEFIKKLNAKNEGIYRLPTEAEWEYACRAGTTGAYSGNNLDEIAWYIENSGGNTHPVGQKKANAFGLYDMHGNVWEGTADWFGNYSSESVTDPKGAASGSYRVIRGGSWSDFGGVLGSAHRNYDTPLHRISVLGFRVVRE